MHWTQHLGFTPENFQLRLFPNTPPQWCVWFTPHHLRPTQPHTLSFSVCQVFSARSVCLPPPRAPSLVLVSAPHHTTVQRHLQPTLQPWPFTLPTTRVPRPRHRPRGVLVPGGLCAVWASVHPMPPSHKPCNPKKPTSPPALLLREVVLPGE